MAKRGENIWHRKDGRWEARYVKGREGNRAIYGYVYARSYGAAKEKQQRAQRGEDSANNETHVTLPSVKMEILPMPRVKPWNGVLLLRPFMTAAASKTSSKNTIVRHPGRTA